MVIKLLITIGVPDVTVALAARGVVALTPGGDGRALPFGLRIFQ